MTDRPTFSIITPVYDPPESVLRKMLRSVHDQSFGAWEHCLVDDGSSRPWIRDLLEEAALDSRVHVSIRRDRGGIVAASNDALALASGDFVALLDHDDVLLPHALEAMYQQITRHFDVDYLYSDEEKVDDRDRRFDTFLKPDWSPDRFRCQMYTNHLSVIRRSLVQELGGYRPGFDGAQDWDLVFRVTERARRIVHVREVLYLWRTLTTSAAARPDAKPWAHEASHKAVTEHVERTDVQAIVEQVPRYPGHYWLYPALRDEPLVSVVIPTGGRTQDIDGTDVPLVVNCVRSIMRRTSYENFEIVVVTDEQVPSATRHQLRDIGEDRLVEVAFDQPFNFSAKINLGAAKSSGDFLLLLNDDIEVLPPAWRPWPGGSHAGPNWPTTTPGGLRIWIESMLVYAMQPGVGAVGAKLYFPDGRLQHAGVIGRHGVPGHPYYGRPGNLAGYWGNLVTACNYLAVTAACVMTSRAAFEAVGGFSEQLPLNYNDVDYCLRLREAGYRSVFLPEVELLHRESASRGSAPVRVEEIEALQKAWADVLTDDPFYGVRFADSDFTIEYGSTMQNYLAKARRLRAEGGIPLVARRAYSRLRHELDRVTEQARRGP